MEEATLGRKQLVRLAVLFEGGMGLLALVLGWLLDVPFWESLELSFADLALGVAACLPLLVLFAVCVRWPVGPLKSIEQFSDRVIRPLFQTCTMLDLALICVMAGFGEEALFRGLLMPLLERFSGDTWLAVGLSSLLFGIMHPITRTYVVLATGVGVYLGTIYAFNDNLLVVMVAHGLYDFVALAYLARFSSGAKLSSAENWFQSDSPTVRVNGKS